MILAVKSWRLRAAARTAIGAGQFEQALELAMQAQEAQRTPGGEALRVLGNAGGLAAGVLCAPPEEALRVLGNAGGLAAGALCAPDGPLLAGSHPGPDDVGEVEKREGLRL
jgi:hypothetical protein